jgi:hypothetical protein
MIEKDNKLHCEGESYPNTQSLMSILDEPEPTHTNHKLKIMRQLLHLIDFYNLLNLLQSTL